MKSVIAPCFAALAVAGCAVCAMDADEPRPQRLAAVTRSAPPPEKAPMRAAAVAPEVRAIANVAPARLLQAVIVDADGRSVARVENYRLRADGEIDMLTVMHGADGSGIQTVMLPFEQFKVAGETGDVIILKTTLTLKPLPEFTLAR